MFNHQKHTTPCNCRSRDVKLACRPFLGMLLWFWPWKWVAPLSALLPPPEGTHCPCPACQGSKDNLCVFSFSTAHSVLKEQGGRQTLSSYRRPTVALLPPSLSQNLLSPKELHPSISLGSFLSQGSLLLHGTVLWPFWRGIKMESLLMWSKCTRASTAIKGSHLLADSW